MIKHTVKDSDRMQVSDIWDEPDYIFPGDEDEDEDEGEEDEDDEDEGDEGEEGEDEDEDDDGWDDDAE